MPVNTSKGQTYNLFVLYVVKLINPMNVYYNRNTQFYSRVVKLNDKFFPEVL